MRTMLCRISDRRTGISGRDYMYRMRCRSLQLAAYRGVRGLHGGAVPGQCGSADLLSVRQWLCHRYTGWERRCELHSVCGGSVQQRIDSRVHDMSRWLRHGYTGRCWSNQLHCVCGGSVQQRIDGAV